MCYIDGIVKKSVVEEVFRRLDEIDIDGILATNYIEELIRDSKYSIFNTTGSTERPDTVVARLLEGRVAIIANGSPSVLTVPYLFVENFQSGDDYYSNFFYANIGRILRFLCFFLTVSVPAVYVSLLNFHKQMMPTVFTLSIISSREGVPFPVIVECIGLLIIFEILRETSARMPGIIVQTLGIVGAIVIGESAVSAKLVSSTMVVVVGISILTGLMIPRLKSAVFYYRLFILICASIIGLYGYVFGISVMIISILSLKSFGVSYAESILKESSQQLKDTFVRVPWAFMIKRPDELSDNKVRQRNKQRER